jgi:hypothetical protein
VLVLHLVCVAVVLASNFRRSVLQSELVRIFACYTQLLDFDPQFTPYYYTFGRPSDDDAIFVVDLYASGEKPAASQPLVKTVRLPEAGSNWLEGRRRYLQLAKLMALYADPENENDDITSEIARAVASQLMRESGNGRAVLRLVRRESQPPPLVPLNAGYPENAPGDPAYDTRVYEADVWLDEDGAQVQRRLSAAEVAPRQNNRRSGPQPPGSKPPGAQPPVTPASPTPDAKTPAP